MRSYKRNDLAVLADAADLFESVKGNNSERINRKLIGLLGSEEFFMAMFRPVVSDRASQSELSSRIAEVYNAAGKARVALAISDAISDFGTRNLDRNSAVFLVSLVNLGMTSINEKASDLGREKDHGEVDEETYQRILGKLNRYQNTLGDLLDYAREIIKVEAKVLSRESGLPKKICQNALYTVPTAIYLDKYKIGFYLNTLLSNIYGYINITNEPIEDIDDVDWNRFFRKVFGKERIADVASLILLEGRGRLAEYDQNVRDVMDCWDSITQFALRGLNQAPDNTRDQMIEIYLKRLNKMLGDHNIDIRVDLRGIDSLRFENLAGTIGKYKSKFEDVMKKAEVLANARPSTRPV